ncbi:MAG: hypothetical protein GX159_07435 [Flavobacteriaceae bacterium]|nr:hypothetical protein [Flavobacteriaceae bacterium]
MLVNLLSGKSFLARIIPGILFLVLFCFKIYPVTIEWQPITSTLLFLISMLITLMFFQYTPLIKNNGLSSWYFFIWMLCFSSDLQDFRMNASLLVCSLIFWRILVAEQSLDNKKVLFEIGFLLSISSFFYPPSLFLAGFLIFVYIYMQSLNLKGFLLFIIGFTLPMALGLQLLYLADEISWLKEYQYAFYLDFWRGKLWALIPIGVLILISWVDHLSQSGTQDINKRHKYFLTFLYFINWIGILIFFGGDNLQTLTFLGLPIALFLTRFTQYRKSEKTKEVLLWLYLIIMAGFYFRIEIMEIYEDLLGNVSF